jgi:hypothetical protein
MPAGVITESNGRTNQKSLCHGIQGKVVLHRQLPRLYIALFRFVHPRVLGGLAAVPLQEHQNASFISQSTICFSGTIVRVSGSNGTISKPTSCTIACLP